MSIARVHYRERQRLTADDLRTEQAYRLGLARRHHLAPHQWGVVRGLDVVKVDDRYLLMPGVAIDGYGRELLVTEPIDLDVDGTPDCLFVTLYYCESPADAQPGRTCHDTPAPRIAQRAKVVTGALVTPPPDSDDLITGLPTDAPPWPVVVDAIGDQEPCRVKRHDAVRYVRHRASLVRSPSARARIKLGLDRRTDVYHFLLTTAGSPLTPRVGIDRDGMTHVWKPLVIWGPKAIGAIAVTASRIVQIEVPFVAGPRQRVQMTGVLDSANQQLTGALRRFAAGTIGPQPLLPIAHALRLTKKPQFLETGPRDSTIALIADTRDRSFRVSEAAPTSFSVVMDAGGGLLAMKRPQVAPAVKQTSCDTVIRERASLGDDTTTVVVLHPAAAFADDVSAREIYAITTSEPAAPVAETTLRISGGAEDKTDVSTRISIGRSPTSGTKDWVPRVRMDGGRRLDIRATKATDPALDVDGTIYLPAIGKDDPLLPDMMSMAFMAGLRQIGRIATTAFSATISGTPATISRGSDLEYKLKLVHPPNAVLRKAVELISGIDGSIGDLTFRTLSDTEAKFTNNAQDNFDISIPNFTHRAAKIQIQVVLLVVESNVPRLVIAPAQPVNVT